MDYRPVNAQEIWDITYSQLELQLTRELFNTVLRGAVFIGVEDGLFVIGVKNKYACDMLQNRMYANIRRVLCDVRGQPTELRFEVHKPVDKGFGGDDADMPLFRLLAEQAPSDEAETTSPVPLHERVVRPKHQIPDSELHPSHIFDRFIVGGGNRIAYEAARAIAESPAQSYNPFLVYGGVGLGKTHLLQAVGHACRLRNLNVIYISSEVFTNDLVDSIRGKTMAMFRDKYRSADVLLVDDVQFIAGKDGTQEEFFHTFNALHTFNKQIVLASDRHPRELATLEDRLRSRFEGGLVADVQPLEFEARLALLHMWVKDRNIIIQPDVLHMVAERAKDNVRELLGLFNQVIIKARFTQATMTAEGVETVLKDFRSPRQHQSVSVTVKRIMAVTATHFQVKPNDLTGKSRAGRINQARQVAMYLAREMTEASLPQIGEIFGKRSHTTVLHGCNKITEDMLIDANLCERVERIRSEVMDR